MAKIFKEEKDQLNAILNITIEKADYFGEYDKLLKKYQKESHLKGFRKGKVPMSYVRKVYGQQILAEKVNEAIVKELNEATKDMDLFGEPLLADDQAAVEFDPLRLGDYTFSFELGIMPVFELKGLSSDSEYAGYSIKVSDASLDEELTRARKRAGERTDVEDLIKEEDLVYVEAREMDGDALKADGHFAEFSIAPDMATDELKKELLKKKKEDTIILNVHDVEVERSPEDIRQYVLDIDKDNSEGVGDMFECTITKVTRVTPAEINQEFFDKTFGEGKVSSEEEARDRLRIDIENMFRESADRMLFANIQKSLLEQNELPLPEAFLKKWIKQTNEKKLTDEQIEREFPFFCEELRWSVIRGRIVKEKELTVSEEEVRNGVRKSILNYMGGQGGSLPGDMIENLVESMMKQEETVKNQAEEVIGGKLFNAVLTAVTVNRKEVDDNEMEDIIKAENKRLEEENEKRRKAMNPEETVEA